MSQTTNATPSTSTSAPGGGAGGSGCNSASLKRKVPNGLPESVKEVNEHFLW